MSEPGANWRAWVDDEGARAWLRFPIGPGCTVTVLVTREPSSKEIDLLVQLLRLASEDQAPPPPPSEKA